MTDFELETLKNIQNCIKDITPRSDADAACLAIAKYDLNILIQNETNRRAKQGEREIKEIHHHDMNMVGRNG